MKSKKKKKEQDSDVSLSKGLISSSVTLTRQAKHIISVCLKDWIKMQLFFNFSFFKSYSFNR